MNIKNNGSFYTPTAIAGWLTERVSRHYKAYGKVKVLEPSCGDGVFVDALETIFSDNEYQLDAVEMDNNALQKASERSSQSVKFHKDDFLFWETEIKYDLVIGNPPYIARKRLIKEQAKKCKEIHVHNGLENKEISNIWTAFLIKSSALLCDRGVLAFILPTELLQVNYSKEIRKYLLDEFDRLEIISFKSLAFEDIEQDTVILIAYRKTLLKEGLYFSEVSNVNQLHSSELNFLRHHGDHNAKWSSYMLTEEDMYFLDKLSSQCKKVSDYCSSIAGIVTAANAYFILTEKDIDKFELNRYAKKIVQRGIFINGSVEISNADYNAIEMSGKPCYILDLNGIPEDDFTPKLKQYLSTGIEQKIHKRYKCQLRNRWFDIPSIWKSEGIFFKRGHQYPKLVVNNANVYVTDSAYRIKMKDDYGIHSLAFSFYNSLTLLYSELNGRYYGGGVLELTPNEFKGLPIPYVEIGKADYKRFAKEFKEKNSIEQLVEKNDLDILPAIKGISSEDIVRIQEIYKKVKQRRLREH